jgi:hypothetical protein
LPPALLHQRVTPPLRRRRPAVLQLWEFSIGARMAFKTFASFASPGGWLDAEEPGSDLRGMRGVCLAGCVFAVMGALNLKNTVETVLEKRRHTQVGGCLLPACWRAGWRAGRMLH